MRQGSRIAAYFASAVLLNAAGSATALASDASAERDYAAIERDVINATNLYLHKRGTPLNGERARSLRLRSFVAQLVTSELSQTEPHLLFACSAPGLYAETDGAQHWIDDRTAIGPAPLFHRAGEAYLERRHPRKDGMSIKALRKMVEKRDARRDRLKRDNRRLPQKMTRSGWVVAEGALDPDAGDALRSDCRAELADALQPHASAVEAFADRLMTMRVEASTTP